MRILSLAVLLLLITGCGSKAPEPLTIETIPPAMQEAFTGARLFVKKTSDTIIQNVKSNQLAGATIQLQALLANQDLTKKQRDVASRSLMAVNLKLSEQAAVLEPPPADAGQPALPPSRAQVEQAAEAAAVQHHYILTK